MATLRRFTADNQALFEASTRDTETRLGLATLRTLFFVMGTLLFLFVVLFVVIRHAAGIMAQQERDRERAQHQLAQWEKMASLGQMVASVTHQLNTPLAFGQSNLHMALQALERFRLPLRTAATFTRLVRGARGEHVNITVAPARKMVADAVDDDFDAETPKAMLEDTLHGLEQMRDLVGHLGEFTRLDRSQATSFDLARSLRNVIYIAHSTMPTDIRVIEEFAELPEARGNVSQLNQVFLNLINNAAQAITGPGTITVRTSLADGRIRIDIADTGCGIAEAYRPHIWDDYFTTKPPGEGTGLGLGIARTIIAEHGGEITVDTRTGADSGTTFSIYLPVAG